MNSKLTFREQIVLRAFYKWPDESHAQLGDRLQIARRTVECHLRNAKHKLGVRTTLAAVLKWLRLCGKLVVCCLACLSANAQVQFDSISISTNRPGQDFTAAQGGTAYFHDKSLCWTVTFTISGAPGDYVLQWKPALDYWHDWVTVYGTIKVHNQPVTVSYPTPAPGTVQNMPASAVWRLKKT